MREVKTDFTGFEQNAIQPWLDRRFKVQNFSRSATLNVELYRFLILNTDDPLMMQEFGQETVDWLRQGRELEPSGWWHLTVFETFYLRISGSGEVVENRASSLNSVSFPYSHTCLRFLGASSYYPEIEPNEVDYYKFTDRHLEMRVRQTYLKRDRSGVGKVVSDCHYLHRLYEYCLPQAELHAAKLVLGEFDYQLIKHNRETGAFTFIQCPNFDEAEEPWLGDSVRVTAAGDRIVQPAKANTQIYHHKWLMVVDNYPGFNVLESKRRSMYWLTLRGVDKSRIGYLSYWATEVVPRLEERMAADREKLLGSSGLNPKKVPTPKNVALSSATVQQMSIF